MMAIDRHEKIMQLLVQHKSISVKTLCDLLQASEATIRRDLTQLENENKLERTHGGAFINDSIKLNYEETFNQKEFISAEEKRKIARAAFEMIRPGDSIVLDAGTTTIELARLIGDSDMPLMIVTNATTISSILARNTKVELYVLGGKVRLNTLATVGSVASEMLKRYNVSKAFVGVNGITIENGLTTPDLEEAEMKRTMLSIADERIILTDSTKFQKVARCQIAPISMVDQIITDLKLSDYHFERFAAQDILVERV
ncbi:MAG: DeoR/GlpR family DNA-binding transcription regulator [Lachnospiraceae bacterium]|nr:DeoR/GlpR family DNA-binding transcription regulator [Lachnospiraceae bacterium]